MMHAPGPLAPVARAGPTGSGPEKLTETRHPRPLLLRRMSTMCISLFQAHSPEAGS